MVGFQATFYFVYVLQVSQTKDLARFHTPEVLRLQQELLRAKESRNIAARQAWAELVSQVNPLVSHWIQCAWQPCHRGMYARDEPCNTAELQEKCGGFATVCLLVFATSFHFCRLVNLIRYVGYMRHGLLRKARNTAVTASQ